MSDNPSAPKIVAPKPENTAKILQGCFCKTCGWPVVFACCNDGKSEFPPYSDSDWWHYCSNKTCAYHTGEGVFEDQPGWHDSPETRVAPHPIRAAAVTVHAAHRIFKVVRADSNDTEIEWPDSMTPEAFAAVLRLAAQSIAPYKEVESLPPSGTVLPAEAVNGETEAITKRLGRTTRGDNMIGHSWNPPVKVGQFWVSPNRKLGGMVVYMDGNKVQVMMSDAGDPWCCLGSMDFHSDHVFRIYLSELLFDPPAVA